MRFGMGFITVAALTIGLTASAQQQSSQSGQQQGQDRQSQPGGQQGRQPSDCEQLGRETNERTISINDVPTAVRNAIDQQAQGGKLDKVEEVTRGGKPFYEAVITKDNRTYEVEIDTNGNVVCYEEEHGGGYGKKNEHTVSIDDVPAAVRTTIQQQAQGGELKKVEESTHHGVRSYEAHIVKNGQDFEAVVDENGKLLRYERREHHGHGDAGTKTGGAGSAHGTGGGPASSHSAGGTGSGGVAPGGSRGSGSSGTGSTGKQNK